MLVAPLRSKYSLILYSLQLYEINVYFSPIKNWVQCCVISRESFTTICRDCRKRYQSQFCSIEENRSFRIKFYYCSWTGPSQQSNLFWNYFQQWMRSCDIWLIYLLMCILHTHSTNNILSLIEEKAISLIFFLSCLQ